MQNSIPIPRLVVEIGFAALNHGLRVEMRNILDALPDWLDDPVQQANCEALLLFGLGRHDAALTKLANLAAEDCISLRTLLTNSIEESKL